LRSDEYRATATPGAYLRALIALAKAVAGDPDCGPAWTTRARLYAEIYALDIPGIERPLEQALVKFEILDVESRAALA